VPPVRSFFPARAPSRRGLAGLLLTVSLFVLGACSPDVDVEGEPTSATDAGPTHDDAAHGGARDATRPDPTNTIAAGADKFDAGSDDVVGAPDTRTGGRPVDASPTTTTDAAARDAALRDADAGSVPQRTTIHLAGDSTVSTYTNTASEHDQAGWGQMLEALFRDGVSVDNRAIGGRTAKRFLDEKRLDQLLEATSPGDYVFVQFGTNDGNRSATYELGGKTYPYYADPQTDFTATLTTYIERVTARGATAVLVTPPPRNSAYCTGGNGTSAHAEAMRQLGAKRATVVLDLNARSVAYLKAICPAPQPEDFFLLRADGTVDGTHFQEHGARVLASLVADALRESGLPLAALRE
jgi:lysophospholipase L1-like esterase